MENKEIIHKVEIKTPEWDQPITYVVGNEINDGRKVWSIQERRNKTGISKEVTLHFTSGGGFKSPRSRSFDEKYVRYIETRVNSSDVYEFAYEKARITDFSPEEGSPSDGGVFIHFNIVDWTMNYHMAVNGEGQWDTNKPIEGVEEIYLSYLGFEKP